MTPALGGGALLVATHILAEFGALSFLRVETFTTAIYDQYVNEFNKEAATLLSGVLVMLAMPLALGEATLRGGRRRARTGRGAATSAGQVALGALQAGRDRRPRPPRPARLRGSLGDTSGLDVGRHVDRGRGSARWAQRFWRRCAWG